MALFNVGPMPTNQLYAIIDNDLRVCDVNEADCSNNGKFLVGSQQYRWNARVVWLEMKGRIQDGRTKPSTGDDWRTLTAIQLVLIARNAQPEKPGAGGCAATTDKKEPRQQYLAGPRRQWCGNDLSLLGADWGCYRYKMFQTVVPIRNIPWRPGR